MRLANKNMNAADTALAILGIGGISWLPHLWSSCTPKQLGRLAVE
jgi:hypothetical protein